MKLILKYLYWDLSWRQGRYEIVNWFVKGLPGNFGMHIRYLFLRKYFNAGKKELYIYPNSYIRGIHKLEVGNNVHIGLNVLMNANGGIKIGDNVLIGPNVKIWSVNHNFEDLSKPIIEQGYIDKSVEIGSNVWVSMGCIILPGTSVGGYSVISAGSVLSGKEYPPYSLIAGNPARKIKHIEEQ